MGGYSIKNLKNTITEICTDCNHPNTFITTIIVNTNSCKINIAMFVFNNSTKIIFNIINSAKNKIYWKWRKKTINNKHKNKLKISFI